MEFKDMAKQVKELFNCDSFDEIPKNIMEIVLKNDEIIYDKYLDIVGDLEIDWIQKIYQFYLADKEEFKQDFTPPSLAKLISKLTATDDEKIVYDMCCGSGSLTLQKWKENPNLEFILHELDTNVISSLLFNISIRNISATLVNGDVLTGETFKVYKIEKGEKYSNVKIIDDVPELVYDTCISNPPFNLKNDSHMNYMINDSLISVNRANMNYAFVLHSIKHMKSKSALILPNSVFSDQKEDIIRKFLVKENLLETVISCPERMFESTSIPVCILVFNKYKKDKSVTFIDASKLAETEVRKQKGELHMKTRVYKREFNVFSDESIEHILQDINFGIEEDGYIKRISCDEIKENEFNFSTNRYTTTFYKEDKTRSFNDIISDINRVRVDKNRFKLTINEKIAKEIGVKEEVYDLMKKANKIDENLKQMIDELNETNEDLNLKQLDIVDNYIVLSKKGGYVKFENIDKSGKLSFQMQQLVQTWSTMIHYLNEEENRYLAELRDALLPLLIDGMIDVSGITLNEEDKSQSTLL